MTAFVIGRIEQRRLSSLLRERDCITSWLLTVFLCFLTCLLDSSMFARFRGTGRLHWIVRQSPFRVRLKFFNK